MFLGRPFCSRRHRRQSVFADFIKALHPVDFPRRLFRWETIKMLLVAGVLLLLILSSAIFLGVRLHDEFQTAKIQQAIQDAGVVQTETGPMNITELPDAMVMSNRIDIVGEAADSVIITLKINGAVQAVTLPREGAFSFDDVELKIGENRIDVLALHTDGMVKRLETLTTTYGTPRLDWLARNVTRGNAEKKQIALTFDGGSGDGAADDILNILARRNIQCTMFLTGRFIRRYPDLTRRIVAEGHEVGNHTWSHPHLTTFETNQRHDTHPGIDRKNLQLELVRTQNKFQDETGRDMLPLWRAPFGEHNRDLRRWAAELGYTQIGWTLGRGETLDALDWVADTTSTVYRSSEETLQSLLNFGDDNGGLRGGIVLMHLDTQRQTDPVHEILPAFIDSMRTRGYEFVTLTKMFNLPSH